MPSVFLSYRRSDAAGHAGRLYDGLVARFGLGSVFMDLDSIGPGIDWVDRIEQAVGASDVMLAVIGRNWLNEANVQGTRRLEDPHDFVRGEIAAALDHGLPVVPVLVGGATMPAAENLPKDLAALARRNAFELSDGRWRSDVERLVKAIADMAARSAPAATAAIGPADGRGRSATKQMAITPPTSRPPEQRGSPRSAVIRFTHLSNWGAAFRVAAPVGGAAVVAVILATTVFTGASNHTTNRPAGTTEFFKAPAPSVAQPGAANPAATPGTWPPHTSAWTVVLASTSSRQAATQIAARAAATTSPTGVLNSSDYSSLRPGFWVAFSGQYPTRQRAAQAAIRWHQHGYAGAYPRFVNGAAA